MSRESTAGDRPAGETGPDGRVGPDGVAELARMGIDPRGLGLGPPSGFGPAAGPARARPGGASSRPTARGVAAPPVTGRATPAGGYLATLERAVFRPAPRTPRAWRDLLRAGASGLLEPSAAAAASQERRLLARVQLRPPEPLVVAFLAGKGGVGASTTAAGVAVLLASLRPDTAALASARSGAGSLGCRLLGRPAPAAPALVDRVPATPPLWVRDRLAVVDGSPWHSPAPARTVVRLLELLRGQHPLTLVDVGNDLGEPAVAALERADQVVLVTSASPDAVAATRTGLSRIHQSDPFRLATVVVAVVCLTPRQHRWAHRRLRSELGLPRGRIVPVGFDPWLAAGERIEPARLAATTRRAYLEIAGQLLEPGAGGHWLSQPARRPGAGR
jgi:MinD-like ATPase involved in chromosome partitioning or flagellar assembly